MIAVYTEEQALAAVSRLTRSRLQSFVELEIVQPVRIEDGIAFRQVDIVRLELLCELTEDFELRDETLGVVMSLIDQLHGVREELRAVLAALQDEPDEVRARIADRLRQ